MNHLHSDGSRPSEIVTPASENAAPVRVQRKRTKGWKMPPNTVSVTRPGKWGNRFAIGEVVQRFSKEKICETFTIENAAQAVACYREYWQDHLANPFARNIVVEAMSELRGKNLACWCAIDQPCHADVLLEFANREATA